MSEVTTPPERPRNPLSNAIQKAGLSAAAAKAVQNWLAELLVAHEHAKLGQGGHTQNQVPLRQVFVDLPIVDSPSSLDQHAPRVLFLEHFLSSAPLSLRDACKPRAVGISGGSDASDSDATDEQRSDDLREPAYGFGATLLIGGPGQGKSTLGQLA